MLRFFKWWNRYKRIIGSLCLYTWNQSLLLISSRQFLHTVWFLKLVMFSSDLQKTQAGRYFFMITLSFSTKNSTESTPLTILSDFLMSDGSTNLPSLSICLTHPIALIKIPPILFGRLWYASLILCNFILLLIANICQ